MGANINQGVQRTLLLSWSSRVNPRKANRSATLYSCQEQKCTVLQSDEPGSIGSHTRLVDWIENMAATERVADLRK